MFRLPPKQVIVNKDTQVRLLEDDGTAYAAADASPSAGGFILEGFNELTLGSELVLLAAATRIVKVTPAAAVAQIATFTVTSTASDANDVFRIVSKSLDLTPTEYQNRDVEIRYQMSTAETAAADIAAHIRDTINGNKFSKVTATAAGAVVTLTAKEKGVTFQLYSSEIAGTFAVTTPASLAVSTYDSIKNVHWPVNFEIDRNLEWLPENGATYNTYYFEVRKAGFVGGQTVPGNESVYSVVPMRVIAKVGTTLDTAMDLLATDMNV